MQLVQAPTASNRLRELREQHDLKLRHMPAIVERDQSTYWRYENGETPVPDDVKRALSARYSVTIEYLMGWDLEPQEAAA